MPSRIVSREPWGWYMKAPPLSSPSSPLLLLLLRLFLFPILNPAVKIHHWSGHICRRSSVFSNVEARRALPLSPKPSVYLLRLSPPLAVTLIFPSSPFISTLTSLCEARGRGYFPISFPKRPVGKRRVAASGFVFFFTPSVAMFFFSVAPREWMVGWLDGRPANHHERSIFPFLATFPVIAALTPRHSRLHRGPCWRGLRNKTVSLLLFIYLFF